MALDAPLTLTDALSLVAQTLERLQLQRAAFATSGSAASLLARASMIAAVQPCTYRLMTSGSPRLFATSWIGLIHLNTGKLAVGSSASREVPLAAEGAPPAAMDDEASAVLQDAWKALLRSF